MQRVRQGAAQAGEVDDVKRRLLIAAVFLLAGAVVNVAMAWGCATWVDVSRDYQAAERSYSQPASDQTWTTEELSVVGAMRICFTRRIRHGVPTTSVATIDVPNWSRLAVPSDALQEHGHEEIVVDARGWPWLSMCSRVDFTTTTALLKVMSSSLWLEPSPRGKVPYLSMRVLPLRPIWPGFAVNTAFYAAILWLLIPGPFVLRRFIRLKRVLCPACAYPRGESGVCSECGKALTERAKVTT